jgi:hypothetical protein
MECGEKFTQASLKLLNELSEELNMRSPVPLFAIIVLPLLVLLNPFPLEAQTLQGQFDWSTSFQVLTIPGGLSDGHADGRCDVFLLRRQE